MAPPQSSVAYAYDPLPVLHLRLQIEHFHRTSARDLLAVDLTEALKDNDLTLELILGYVCYPIAWLLGVSK